MVLADEVPQRLLGKWALVAGSIDHADFALGRGGASKVFDEWTISPRHVRSSWGALDIGRVEELAAGRIALVSTKGSAVQYLFVPRSTQPPSVFLIAYVRGEEKMRGLLVSHEGLALAPNHDWLGELRASERESASVLRTLRRETVFVMEGKSGERLVFEEPDGD